MKKKQKSIVELILNKDYLRADLLLRKSLEKSKANKLIELQKEIKKTFFEK